MDQNLSPEKEAQAAVEQILPEKKKPGRKALQIFAVVVLLALVAGGIYAWQNNRLARQESKVAETKKVVVINLKPEDVTSKIKADLADDYTVLDLNTNNKPAKNEVSVSMEKTSPTYKASGYGFYTNYDGGSTITVVTKETNATAGSLPDPADKAMRQRVAAIYAALGLKKQTAEVDSLDGNIDPGLVYEGKGLTCTVDTPEAETSGTSASCGSLSEYPNAAIALKPFADALGQIDSNTTLTNLKIKDSLVTGYQHAQLGQGSLGVGGGSQALFYKKAGSNWKYFKNVQEAPACTDYNTTDLRSAFKGEKCYDQKTNSSDALVK